MATDHPDLQLRQYLLGDLADQACDALERDYFAREGAFDRMEAAEHELIEDYLSGRLTPHERDRFERHYLATPGHRHRLAITRELKAAASAELSLGPRQHSPSWWTTAFLPLRGWSTAWKAALAAAVVLLALGVAWTLRARSGRHAESASTSAPQHAPQPPPIERPRSAPVVVSLALSPASVRATDDSPTLAVAPGTDLVVLRLEGEPGAPPISRGRAVVRTVSGNGVWRGPAEARADQPSLAHVEIPAGKLPPDDYIIELFGTDAKGRETERSRYFLRVRAR